MFDTWRRNRAIARVRPGTGKPLQRFRWWQLAGRALFHHAPYAVDVRHWQNQGSGEVKANLYRDGRHVAESTMPATFPIDGGIVEVAMSGFGVKRCHFVADDGNEHQLFPDPASAEGRRARLDADHPTASRLIGVVSVIMLLAGMSLLVLHLAEQLSKIPPVTEAIGMFTSPVDLPPWLTITLGVAAALASMERALRMRYHWLLDAAGN